jgi:hypothetical protein
MWSEQLVEKQSLARLVTAADSAFGVPARTRFRPASTPAITPMNRGKRAQVTREHQRVALCAGELRVA